MASILRNAVIVFLAINAIFWGLFPHTIHCKFVGAMGVSGCPSHTIHITMGVVAFALAVALAQWEHIMGKKH
jgi:hypothetical protein